MKKTLTRAMGVAAFGFAATALFIPQVAAQPAPNLAPGVDCEGFQCSNNTDDTYRIEWDAICANPGTDEPRKVVSTRAWVQPHQEQFMDVGCPFGELLGGGHHHSSHGHGDDLVQGYVVDAHYKAALVDNPAPLPTGSGG